MSSRSMHPRCVKFLAVLATVIALKVLLAALQEEGSGESVVQGGREERRRIAFMFIVPPCFYIEPLWHEYFRGESRDDYSIVVHQQGSSLDDPHTPYESIAFQSSEARAAIKGPIHYVPSLIDAARYTLSLARITGLLMRQAYFSNEDTECFVLVSDTTVPLVPLAKLKEIMFDELGNCRSNVVMEPWQNGVRTVKKVTQWLVLNRNQVSLLLDYGMEKAENAAVDIIHENSIPGKRITFAFDETLYPTALNVVFDSAEKRGNVGDYSSPAYPSFNSLTAVFWDSGYLDSHEMYQRYIKRFSLGFKVRKDFYTGTPTDGQYNEGWGHPMHFDASMLNEITMHELYEICEKKPFLRKIVLKSVFDGGDASVANCSSLKTTFIAVANVGALEW